MFTIVNTSPFIEHPTVDISRFEANEFDITIFEENQIPNFLNAGVFFREQYCKCLLHKLFTIPKSKIKPFIQYQCSLMTVPITWLNKFEKLVDLNRELFTDKQHIIKFEKALVVIELMRDSIENQANKPINKFDINYVKSKLKEYTIFEDKISYLCEVETDYKQLRPSILNPHSVPFDEQISLEIDKLTKQESLKEKSQQRSKSPLNNDVSIKPQLKLNCNINYFVDVFYQLSHEKQAVSGSLKDIAEFISHHFLDKDGNPISSDTVYTMLKPSNFNKRPKGNSRFKLE